MVIWKCTDFFMGFFGFVEGRGLRRKIFPWRNLSGEKRNSMKGAQDFLALLKL